MRAKIRACGAAALGDVKSPADAARQAAAAERFSILVDGEVEQQVRPRRGPRPFVRPGVEALTDAARHLLPRRPPPATAAQQVLVVCGGE